VACWRAVAHHDRVAAYHAAPLAEIDGCLQECKAGNGASCARVARAASGNDCGLALLVEACRAGFPAACSQVHDRCDDVDVPTRKDAVDALRKRCGMVTGSWSCFFLASAARSGVVEAEGVGPDAIFEAMCKAPCPGGERCYRAAACREVGK
jgi:hypothetical protein